MYDSFNLHTILRTGYNYCPHSADEQIRATKVNQLAQGLAVRKWQSVCQVSWLHSPCS